MQWLYVVVVFLFGIVSDVAVSAIGFLWWGGGKGREVWVGVCGGGGGGSIVETNVKGMKAWDSGIVDRWLSYFYGMWVLMGSI